MTWNLKTTQNDEEMHYKITIFGACTPYPRLIYWIASSISRGKKDDMSSKSGSWWWVLNQHKNNDGQTLTATHERFSIITKAK